MNKVVFLAGPFRGPNAWAVECNIRAAEVVLHKLLSNNILAYCPHTHTRFFDGALPDEVYLKHGLEMLKRCDAVYAMSDWNNSTGTQAELRQAKIEGIPVLYSFQEVLAWADPEQEGV